jgi:hypothetical protein
MHYSYLTWENKSAAESAECKHISCFEMNELPPAVEELWRERREVWLEVKAQAKAASGGF